jgi:RNA polymerase sigma factor (sigma-70 family)
MFGAISRLFRTGTAAGLSDAQLLERFLLCHHEAAEAAFAALVERHGPMVLAVCRRVLNDPHDAQDAFQATFLVLVRKAGTIRKRESIAHWLRGVALRVSTHARADSVRRRAVERRAGTGSSIAYETTPADREVWDEVELLPQGLRAVVMLCYLEGLTHEQAARRLGWPVGTVRSRLARARDRLRTRLTRRGLAPDAAFLPMLSFRASSLPEGFIDATVKAAMLIAARDAAEAGLVSTSAAALTEGVLRTMLITKLKTAAATLLAAGAIASGVGLYAYQGPAPSPGTGEQAPSSPGRHDDAIRQPPAVDMEAIEARRLLQALDFEQFAAKVQQLVRRARQGLAEGDMDRAVRDLKEIESDAIAWEDALRVGREGAQAAHPTSPTRAPGSLRPSPRADQAGPQPQGGRPHAGNNPNQPQGSQPQSGQPQGGTNPNQPQGRQPQGGQPQAGNNPSQPQGGQRLAGQPQGGQPQAGPQPGPTRDTLPASAGRRLDELERKVDRLVRALQKDGREDASRRVSADPGATPVGPPPPGVKGVVRKVNDRTGRVEIDLGLDDGLTRGQELAVYRADRNSQSPWEGEYLGRIRILGTNPDDAFAKVIELIEGKQIREGDLVSARTPPSEGDRTSPAR